MEKPKKKKTLNLQKLNSMVLALPKLSLGFRGKWKCFLSLTRVFFQYFFSYFSPKSFPGSLDKYPGSHSTETRCKKTLMRPVQTIPICGLPLLQYFSPLHIKILCKDCLYCIPFTDADTVE